MKCELCGEDKNFWTEMASVPRIDNSAMFYSVWHPTPPRKRVICWQCLDITRAALKMAEEE